MSNVRRMAVWMLCLGLFASCNDSQNRAFRAKDSFPWISIPIAHAAPASPLLADAAKATATDAAPSEAASGPEATAEPSAKPTAEDAGDQSATKPDTDAATAPETPAPAPTPTVETRKEVKFANPADLAHMEVEVWSALLNADDLQLDSPIPLAPKTKGFEDVFYDHPFLKTSSNVKPVFKRVIANDLKNQNFDMRDGLMLPMPGTLTAEIPGMGNRTLAFSYCILDNVFTGEREKEVALTWTLGDGNDAAELTDGAPVKLGLAADPRCTTWTEARIPLPDPKAGTETLRLKLKPKSGKHAQQALVVANLSLLVRVDDPASVEKLAERIGPAASPNIVVFFLDAARGDCVGPTNTTFPSVTPTIDALAKEGVTFTDSFSVSNQTRPSITGFLQSQHPTVGSFHSRSWNFKDQAIAAYYHTDPPLLPRLLEKAGFLTASIGRNHFQYGVTKMALDPGFELIWDNRFGQTDTVHIIDRSIQFLKQNKDRRFFLQINISPTHQPYNPPEKYKTWAMNRLKNTPNPPARKDYLAELYYADQEVGRFLKVLRELQLDKRTIILITADHGETMHNSHSCYSEVFKTICHTSHGLTLYDEEIHVPMIFWAPFLEGMKAQVRHNVVSALDVVPTLLHLVGLPNWTRHMGRSLVGDLMGEEAKDEEIYVESRLSSAVRIGKWKYIYHHKKDDARTASWKSGGTGDQELYDVKADPFETKNLIQSKPQEAAKLREALKRLRTGFQAREEASRKVPWSPVAGQSPSQQPAPAAAPAGEGNPGEGNAADGQPAEKQPANEAPQPADGEAAPQAGETPQDGDAPDPQSAPNGTGEAAQPATPDQSGNAPKPVAAASPKGHLYMALNADSKPRKFRGTVRTEGRFVALEAFRENPCIGKADERSIEIQCDLERDSFRARVVVDPPDSPVSFDLTMDDDLPVDRSHFYLGRFGVALAEGPELRTPEEFAMARSSVAPNYQPGFDAGVFVWHDMVVANDAGGTGGAPEDSPFEGQETIQDEATRNALKELGYWK